MSGFDEVYGADGQLKASAFDAHYATTPTPAGDDPKGGMWYETHRGAENVADPANTNSLHQLLSGLISTDRTIGNDATRGLFRAPATLATGSVGLVNDAMQYVLDGTPWEKTTDIFKDPKVPDWLKPKGADEFWGKHLGLYSTDEPTDLRRYPGRAAEFATTTLAAGGGPRSLISAATSGLGSQAGSDAFPGNKYAPVIGGILGALGGSTLSTIGEPKPVAPGPSFPEMKAALDAETQDAGLMDYTPQVKDYANRLQQKKLIEGVQNLAETAHGTGAKALDAIQPIMDKAEPTFGPAMKKQWAKIQAADSGGGLLARLGKGAVAHTAASLFGIPHAMSRPIIAALEHMATKPNAGVLKELEKMLEVARTQQMPPRRSAGLGRAPAGLLGVLGQ